MIYVSQKPPRRTPVIESVSGRVYNQIKALILCNAILPGQKLHHQELSERLGVSRTPVREALTRLAQEGYVSLLPNRGFICKEIGMQEAQELYDLREALEAFAVEAAIAKMTESTVDGLSRMVSLYGEDVRKRFSRDRLIYDQDLHLEIARASGNETLVKHLGQLFERIILKRRTDGLYDPARGMAAHQEHLKIFSAMKRREIGEAVMLIRRHIRNGKENVLADLRQREEIRGDQSQGSPLIG